MAYNITGKQNKELIEDRNTFRQQIKSYLASENDKTSENDNKYSQMMSDIETIDQALKKRSSLGTRFPDAGEDSAAGVSAGTKIDDRLTIFNRGQSVAASYGNSQYGLAEVIRNKVLGRPMAALSEDNSTAGGMVVPVQMAAGLIDQARSKSVMARAGCQFGIMNSAELRMPKLTSDATFQVKIENESFTEDTAMAFGAITFYPLLIGTFITMSRELAEDAAGFASEVEDALSKAFAVQLDRFPLLGTTADRVRVGILDDTSIGETSAVGVLTWTKIAAEATTIRGLNFEPNAVLLHPTKRDPVLDSVTGGSGEYLGTPPSLTNVQMLDSTSITSTKGLVGDFTKLIIMVRGGPLIESSTVAGDAFKKHQVAIKLYWRGDYGVLYPSAFRRLSGIT